MPRRRRLLTALAAAVVVAAALPWALRVLLWRWEQNPVLRGRRIAAEAGCFACHRPPGSSEIPNPGSRWGSVPRFGSGNAMMYSDTRQGIEETIRFGAPRSWLDDPEVAERLATQHLRMPAYGARLSDRQIADVTAYAAAVEGVELGGDERVAAGRRLARTHGCVACHGVEGAGGLPNPGSLGGFIPGFAGGNFPDLVRDEAEFREWVLDGRSRRLERNPVVRFFQRRQALSMPHYRDLLGDDDLAALWAWVEALRAPADG